ncbi:hypothetical protein V6M85_10825 [Sulfolobus tengchongensis]|uniref:Metallophosphoesterase TT1561-like domain-containing protein n=1 Tax=Sulfolobus tengchongensis TaxID=207809 RepID=A0AAX4KYL1_9CREN
MSGIRKITLIAGFQCDINLIELLNNFDTDLFIGLGDIECPQFIRNFQGIIGEMEDVSILKYLRNSGRYFTRILNISSDFSSDIVVTHYPPKDSITGIIDSVKIGLESVLSKVLSNQPKILFHAHSEIQGDYYIGRTRVISIGNLNRGYYVEYYPEKDEIKFKSLIKI